MSVIIAALRTAVAPRGGAFSLLQPHQLGEPVIRELLRQNGIAAEEVDQLVMASSLGGGGNPARVLALAAGLPEVSGLSIDTQCAGGLDAVAVASSLVDSGMAEIVIAGGAESYSRRPVRGRTFPDGRPPEFYSRPAFTPDPQTDPDMTEAAADLARDFALTREAQDQYAIGSHRQALAARDYLTREIVPVAETAHDIYPRQLTPRLAQRTPLLAGSVSLVSTAIEADGAAFCLVVSDKVAARLKPSQRIKISGYQTSGADSRLPGYAPVVALKKLFSRFPQFSPQHCLTEMMEAYSAQAMVCIQQGGLDPELVNLHGGALARGHPIGASGAVLICRMFHDLPGSGLPAGICVIAAAGGLGSVMLLTEG